MGCVAGRKMQAQRPASSGITMTLPDDSAYPQDGRLDFVDRAVDPRTGTLALRAAFPNPARMLQPGQYVRLRVLLAERPDALVVPQAAIQESQGSASLFVVAPDQTVQARTRSAMGTRVGPLWGRQEGVKPGEHVVVKGLQQIRAWFAWRRPWRRPPTPGADAGGSSTSSSITHLCSVLAIVIGCRRGGDPVPAHRDCSEITPPQVVVTANYPGASAEVVEQTVATPIEQQVNGVEDMIYMSSRSGSDGTMTLTVTFKVGADLDIAAVNVQNRVSIAQAKLPADVTRQGLTIVKQSPDLVEIVALTSPDGSRDELFLANYATLQVVDVLARVRGVGQVTVFNGRDYGMRLWLNPDRLASLGSPPAMWPTRFGSRTPGRGRADRPAPVTPRAAVPVHLTTRGRLSTPAEFEDIILRTRSDGSLLRVRDVARVELGAQSYGSFGRVGGKPAALIGIFQLPGANALDVSKGVQAAVARLAPSFPSGVTHERPYNTTEFVRVSIEEVVLTLFIAIGLVVLVVYVFLQDWRATLIPTMTIPVSLVGTFAVISVFGFSINTLTLFGLVLAIGIVVDDAIVVVENTQRHLDEEGLDPREATRRATAEVVGPVIATALVLMAVFIPIAFLPGITGQLYRQFALTIAVSVALSALNALTLTPALCALLLRPAGATRKRWLARTWDAAFLRLTNGYDRSVRRIVQRSALAVVVLLLLSGAGYALLRAVPTGFAPTEDQGYLLVNVQLPDAASVERTDAVVRQIEKILLETPGVETVVAIGGRSFITGVNGPNVASLFPRLTPWSKRKAPELQAGAILARLRARLSSLQEAPSGLPAPPHPGHQLRRRVPVRAAKRGPADRSRSWM